MRNRITPKVTVLLMLLVAFAFASIPALATSTVVTFRSADNTYEVELYVGGGSKENDGIAGAMIRWPGYEHRDLPFTGVKYHMDKEHTRAGAKFVNPGDPQYAPSFTVEIEGRSGRLTVGKRVIPGSASWIVGPYAYP
ncbi:hypothetical protein [Xanthomonas arboricola]|uniref:hypothetical protein n=1 Tax=Xanthomonas arboricola TaxID=56448 RepID=UPI000CC78262|nr:hypothetical protein [Xanthomonas arboricola]SOU02042.1 hypothetical protein CFBP6773_03109 [Xanthomonas arboricola pv. fragariae]